METYFATFGQGQSLRQHYVRIEAASRQAAHVVMNDKYGTLWAFMYSEGSLPRLHEDGLTEVPFGTANERL